MSYQMISNKQLAVSVSSIIILVVSCMLLIHILFNYLDLPDVYVGQDGTCVKVINFKNGDGYTCQDKDVTLRKYVVVNVQ